MPPLCNSAYFCTDSEKNDDMLFIWAKLLWYVNRDRAGDFGERERERHAHTQTLLFISWMLLLTSCDLNRSIVS